MAMSKNMWLRKQERCKRQRQRRTKRRQLLAIIVLVAAIAALAALIIIRNADKTDAPTSQTTAETTDISPTLLSPRYTTTLNTDDINLSFFKNSAFLGNSVADTINKYNLVPSCDFYTSVNLDVDNVYSTIIGYSATTAADQLKTKKFNKIFLSFGEREIASGNAYDFADSYESLVEKIKSYQTTSQIYLIAIPPITKSASNAQTYGMTMEKVREYNEEIRNIASDLGVFYINSPSALAGADGYLHDGVSADGINLNRDCSIELLSYISKSSHDPDKIEEDEAETENSETETSTASPSATPRSTATPQSEEPEPTVNVLKDSAINAD